MFKLLTVLATGLAAVNAYHAPGTQVDGTNAITSPNTLAPVTVGAPFPVTWDGSGFGDKISLLLWRGPGDALVFLKPIADSVDNTGTFLWTPDSSLEDDVTHYGLQVVSELDGSFQWSTQFGVINKNPLPPSSSSSLPSSAPSSSSSVKPTSKLHPPPTKSLHIPSSKPTSPPSSVPQQPPAGGDSAPPAHSDYTPSAPETYTSYVAAPKPTGYTGPYTNSAGRFAIGAGSAVVALGAAVLLL